MTKIYCAVLLLLFSAIDVRGQQERYSLDNKLKDLARQANITLSYNPTTVVKVETKPADKKLVYGGAFELSLRALLSDTGLGFEKIDETNYFITPVTSEKSPLLPAPVIIPASKLPNYRMAKVALKTNLLYDATTTINLGLEIALGKRTTIDISANYNPWVFLDNVKLQHISVQPEFRFYLQERFKGHFFGVHLFGAQYNIGGLSMFAQTQQYRFEGYLAGAGISYGYQWALSDRVNMEASIGGGYARMWYDKSDCRSCGSYIESGIKNYLGPTKAALSLIIILN